MGWQTDRLSDEELAHQIENMRKQKAFDRSWWLAERLHKFETALEQRKQES